MMMRLKNSLLAIIIGFGAALIVFTVAPKEAPKPQVNSQSVVSAKLHEFSMLDYNTALEHYNKGEYALSYNTLLNANAPKEAYKAFGWDIK